MITIYDWFGYDLPIEQRYRLIRAAGFDGVLLWWSDGFGRGEGYRNGPKLAREAGLFIENIHAPVEQQNNLWLDNLDGAALLDVYLRSLSDCAEFDIPTMVMHLPEEAYPHNALGLERVKRIVEHAERLNVDIALENVRNLSNVSHMLDRIDSTRLGFCYDCAHHEHYFPDADLLGRYGSRLKALHLHDDNGSWGQHGLPLDGSLDWPKIMKNIAATGYSGATAIEPMNWDYLDLSPEEFLRRAFERAKQVEALFIQEGSAL